MYERLDKLMERIGRLPPAKLAQLEKLLTLLECGNSLPLSATGDSSPVAILGLPSGGQPPQSKIQSGGRLPCGHPPVPAFLSGAETNRPKPAQPQYKDWPHAPMHRLSEHGTYIVTAGTLYKEHLFRGPERLRLLETVLLRRAKERGWRLEAWAVFSNHYHFVAHSDPASENLGLFLKGLHGETATELNRLDRTSGREVWHNFWDTQLTFERSYLARLNYIHQNAVKHHLVPVANRYPWCSAAWFERTATPAQVKTIYRFKTDKLKVRDDFEPV